MAAQLFYVDDTVRPHDEGWKIGVVERTCGNVDSHAPQPELAYPNGLIRGKGVARNGFENFLRTGIPPRGTVLITFAQLPWQLDQESVLMLESDLVLLDRALLAGDIVKRHPTDSISGTVVQASSTATLLQPLKWRDAQLLLDQGLDIRNNFSPTAENMLHDIPTQELRWPHSYESGDFILHKDWVGRISDCGDELHIRLSNNSVVVPEDSLDIEDGDAELDVGDFVKTTKPNLRRGHWRYGAYTPRIEPAGFIAEAHPLTLDVDWLSSRYPTGAHPQLTEPPEELDPAQMLNGEATLYNRQSRAGFQLSPDAFRLNFEVSLGDRVRFHDITGAAVKYDGSTPHGKLEKIQRTDALGYDINVFLVGRTATEVDVQWQDGTVTRKMSVASLIPFDVFDAQEELWPGEMVTTKPNLSAEPETFIPERVGIVQSVHAQDRMAAVQWIPHASLSTTLVDEDQTSMLLPESRTGLAEEGPEEVSLYEIAPVTGIARRIGDYVILVPPSCPESSYHSTAALTDINKMLSGQAPSMAWFGEVVSLGLDGLLTIRLAAADPVRDVRVPWECTHLVWSSDQDSVASEDDEEAMDDMNQDESEEVELGSDAEDPSTAAHRVINGLRSLMGSTENAGIAPPQVSAEEDAWLTDDDDDDSDEMHDDDADAMSVEGNDNSTGVTEVSMTASEAQIREDVVMDGTADDTTTAIEPGPQKLISDTYATMFAQASSESTWPSSKPEPFAVLEGTPPDDHPFWTDNLHKDLSAKRLRRVQKEHKTLSQALPDGVFVRTWEGSIDCMRIMMLGPLQTPYEYAPFIFDLYIGSSFPQEPPSLHFHSWTDGHGPCNPNLYEDGKVCLSLLGTWPGDEQGESWTTDSTILQIVVSLLGLVLVQDPYFNEAGYEARVGSIEYQIPSKLYSERVFLRSRYFIEHAISHSVKGFDTEIISLYHFGPRLLHRATTDAIDIVRRSRRKQTPSLPRERTLSAGAVNPLSKQIEGLIRWLPTEEQDGATAELREARAA